MQNDSARPDQSVHVSPSIPPPAAPVATTALPANTDVPVTDVQPPAAPVISTLLAALTVLCTGIPQLKDVDVRGLRKWSTRLNQMHEEWEDKSGAGIEEDMRVQAMVTKAREVLLTGLKNKIADCKKLTKDIHEELARKFNELTILIYGGQPSTPTEEARF
jgi:hypothetical protein